MSAIERFFYYLENEGLKHTPIEKKLGLSNGYLGKMRDRNASIGSDVMEKIVSYFPDLSPEWLLTGNGPMLRSKGVDDKNAPGELSFKIDNIQDVIDLATQLGMQIKENEHLHRENMRLVDEINNLKSSKRNNVRDMYHERHQDALDNSPDIAAEP